MANLTDEETEKKNYRGVEHPTSVYNKEGDYKDLIKKK